LPVDGVPLSDRPESEPHTLPPAIVVGMDSVTGLQTARILAGHGIPVLGIARDPGHPCCRTTACRQIMTADTGGEELVSVLLALAPELERPAVLIPCTDQSVLVISRNRERLTERYRIALPEPEVVEMLVDKARFYAFAQRIGLPIPTTLILRNRDDATEAAGALRYPAILKPALKTRAWERHARKAYRISTPEELLACYDRYAALAESLVVQEWIPGTDTDHYTCNAYFGTDGAPLVTFTTRKLRQWPIFGGEACLGEESDNEVVRKETVRLFGSVSHRGLAYLEMKQDARTGAYLIIEPNVGRPTGRSATAEAAGVELLFTLYCDLAGLPLPENRHQLFRGVKWIHMRRDVQAALHHWWRGDLTLAGWLRSLRGRKKEALFSWRDPLPFWADLVRVGRRTVARERRV
jgi:D-aspartate ligase